ncbi:hypothetical protein ACI77F_07330 [Pseudomonas tritici]|uniref:hypothetical protein n=1 Tax=Pseudomonas tritici TaxID=2745518 RepID=UPI00387B4B86
MTLYYGEIGTPNYGANPDEWPMDPIPDGFVLMEGIKPDNRPDRFGDWIARANGVWGWVKYPDPPFNIVYHEGKLKNSDTMEEVAIELLPGNLAERLAAIEAAVFPTPP